MTIEQILQKFYDAEINVSISSFWDAKFTVKIGDEINGFRAEEDYVEIEDIPACLERLLEETRRVKDEFRTSN